jgi:hypothetical protein
MDETVTEYIDACLTELVSELDANNHLGNNSNPPGIDQYSFMSMSELRRSGLDQCGYRCITRPVLSESNRVYMFYHHVMPHENDTPNGRNARIITFSPQIISKASLTQLPIQSVKCNIEVITELSHINPNGTVASIQAWAQIAFQDKMTHIIDRTQQRAFEVIVSAFITTFHDEAEQNVETTGTLQPYRRHDYIQIRHQLKKLTGLRNHDTQLIMFLTGAGGSGKTEVINAVLAYAKGFCIKMNMFSTND